MSSTPSSSPDCVEPPVVDLPAFVAFTTMKRNDTHGSTISEITNSRVTPMTTKDRDIESATDPNHDDDQLQPFDRESRCKACMLFLAMLVFTPVVLFLSVKLWLADTSTTTFPGQHFGTTNKEDGPNATSTTTSKEQWQDLDLSSFTIAQLEDPNSAQSRAYEWIQRDTDNTSALPQWRQRQRFALATVFYDTQGDQWDTNKDWLDHDIDECEWFQQRPHPSFLDSSRWAISSTAQPKTAAIVRNSNNTQSPKDAQIRGSVCDHQGRIRVLSLSDNGLRGRLPLELVYLSGLVALDVSGNPMLRGSLPVTLMSLLDDSLRWVNLKGNSGMSGVMPDHLCQELADGLWFECSRRLCGCSCPC